MILITPAHHPYLTSSNPGNLMEFNKFRDEKCFHWTFIEKKKKWKASGVVFIFLEIYIIDAQASEPNSSGYFETKY